MESINGAVKKLLDAGIFLSQIRFLSCFDAESATVFHDVAKGETTVQWMMGHGQQVQWQRAADTASLGDAVKGIIRVNKN